MPGLKYSRIFSVYSVLQGIYVGYTFAGERYHYQPSSKMRHSYILVVSSFNFSKSLDILTNYI